MDRKSREQFLMAASRLGLNDYMARRLCRLASTHNRLAEAECNGDWPCDNGERQVVECSRCGSGYVRSAMFRDHTQPKIQLPGESKPHWIPLICKSCKTQDNISALCREYGIGVEFQGDPRGWTVTLKPLAGTQSA